MSVLLSQFGLDFGDTNWIEIIKHNNCVNSDHFKLGSVTQDVSSQRKKGKTIITTDTMLSVVGGYNCNSYFIEDSHENGLIQLLTKINIRKIKR